MLKFGKYVVCLARGWRNESYISNIYPGAAHVRHTRELGAQAARCIRIWDQHPQRARVRGHWEGLGRSFGRRSCAVEVLVTDEVGIFLD
jgi:hypothetical protein